jgi:hypothetical protein
MPVIVNPINSISVKINQASPRPTVSSSIIFQGSTLNDIANAAYAEANAAYAIAVSSAAAAANNLPLSGGEITGNLIVDGTITGFIDCGIFS